jgi:conjugal transfer mating pair stabilization protein TraG
MYDIHVFHSGAIARDVIVAVSTFLGSMSMATMMGMVALVSVPLTIVSFIGTKSPKAIVAWCLTTALVPTLLLQSTTDVQIIDSSNPMKIYSATRVPLIVAFPAHIATTYMYGATTAFESVFHVNDDEAYSKTGMLFGATLINKSASASIRDVELQRQWKDYIRNCIHADIVVNHKYTYNDLLASSDILSFLANHSPSPLRGILMDESLPDFAGFKTCAQALPLITSQFDSQASLHLRSAAKWLGSDKSEYQMRQPVIESLMSRAQASLMSISQNSRELIRQGMVINATRNGVVDAASAAGANSAAQNLAAAQTELQSVNTMVSVGKWAQKKIPLIHTILILLIIAVSPLVLAAAMLPNLTISVLMNSIKGYLYVATWPVMFTVINFIFMSLTKANLPNAVDGSGLSFSNYADITSTNNELAATAGWFMMFVPYAAKMAVSGASGFMQNAAMQFAGMVNGITGGVAREISTGNITLGSSHDNEHSFNNINANKHHTDFTDIGGSAKQQYADGSIRTDFAAGNYALDGTNAISKLGTSLNMGESLRESLTEQQTQADSNVSTATESLTQAQSTLTSDLIANTKASMQSTQEGSGTSSTETDSIASDYSEMDSLVNTYAKNNGMSYDEAYSHLVSDSTSSGASVGAEFMGSGAKTSVDGSNSETHKDGEAYQHGESKSDNATIQAQFNERLSHVEQYAKTHNTNDSSSESDTSTHSLSSAFNNVETAQHSVTEAKTHSEAVSKARAQASDKNSSYSENMSNAFVEFVTDKKGDEAQGILTGVDNDTVKLRGELAGEFIEMKANEQINHFEPSQASSSQQPSSSVSDDINHDEPPHPMQQYHNHLNQERANEQAHIIERGGDSIHAQINQRGEQIKDTTTTATNTNIENTTEEIVMDELIDKAKSLSDKS